MTIVLGATSSSSSSIFKESPYCQHCQREGIYYSKSSGATVNRFNKHFLDGPRRAYDPTTNISFRCRYPLFGSVQTHWLPVGQDLCLSKVRVASDFSDSVPDSSSYMKNHGYHPLEELKVSDRSRETMLTTAEIARTTVEANNNALLVFPGMVHCEPHTRISWAESQYFVDEYGDIFFEIFDDENILQDRWAVNPVNVFIGMDIPVLGRISDDHSNTPVSVDDDVTFYDESFETEESEVSDSRVDWGMPGGSHTVHPMYFAKCLTKAIKSKYRKQMDHPSNGISILGCLTPAMMEDESYIRGNLHLDDTDDDSDLKDDPEGKEEEETASYRLIDGELSSSNSKYGVNMSSTVYKLEMIRIELFSVYGVQSTIDLEDFQEAQPDFLVHSASAIVERFTEKGLKCDAALKALCRKKGHFVEGANLIGVDSLGMDVRVFCGVEVQTLRFPFKARATSESGAEKKMQRMLFPRYHRKKINLQRDAGLIRDPESF